MLIGGFDVVGQFSRNAAHVAYGRTYGEINK